MAEDYVVKLSHIYRYILQHIDKEYITLADGTECMPAHLEPLEGNGALITIKEGKYHQVKRMFGTVGLGVNELKRLSIGNFALPSDLSEGECRELTETELSNFTDYL